MSIVDFPYYEDLIFKKTIDIGDLYFFKKFVVCEFNEGININFDNFNEAKIEIEKQYGNTSFGFISNRIHSYSILVTDAPIFNEIFKNLKAYATVTYSELASKVFEIENHFFNFNRRNFDNLEDAIQWIEYHLKETAASI
ncbi:hypothetical protein [Psychroserpens luteus]|uniref:STAS/SEC14 domain-containing protein n=1 Tax=Psychroserpens luteus TaxID=1434066 RepID=A0ABW5ZXV0_9FLAO|nr:hypothetical protein [Psychroserpens luteus]